MMVQSPDVIRMQIELIKSAMAKAGVWSHEIPAWIDQASPTQIPDIWQWLQYIYLPMRMNETWYKPHYIAPVLSPYMNTTPELKQILQLVIELDSISPTIEKKI
jgi:uncharacterized protein YqcC (DUF446 family)